MICRAWSSVRFVKNDVARKIAPSVVYPSAPVASFPEDFTKVMVLRMRAVPALDISAMRALEQLYARCKERNIKLVLSHVNEQPYKTMEKSGFVEKVGKENFRATIQDALSWAEKISTEDTKKEA